MAFVWLFAFRAENYGSRKRILWKENWFAEVQFWWTVGGMFMPDLSGLASIAISAYLEQKTFSVLYSMQVQVYNSTNE
jgi:broad specificity polyphosphatase/5'/3'-nucleotidase SurE